MLRFNRNKEREGIGKDARDIADSDETSWAVIMAGDNMGTV